MSAFPWADFRTTKGAVKLHLGLNHAGYLPEFVTITEGKKHDVTVARMLNFAKGSVVAIDKAYNDYAGYKLLTDKDIFFVTRLKCNAKYRILERWPVLKVKGLRCDQTIEFTGPRVSKKCPVRLLQLNLFEKRDLMALLRGDPPDDRLPDANRMMLIEKLTGQQ